MKPIKDFLSELHQLQIKLWREGDRLRYSAPQGTLDSELLAQMRERKLEILAFLQQVDPDTLTPIQPISRSQDLVLSYAQQRLWFLDQLELNKATYNIPQAIRLVGVLDVTALDQSFNVIVQRHETLRTTFTSVAGEPVLAIAPALTLTLPVVDLQHLSATEQETQVLHLATEEARQPFDLQQEPLLRTKLLRLNSQEHVLLLTMHHIIADGWSMGVLFNELVALYKAFTAGNPSPLSELPIQYVDFAHWQRQWLQGKTLKTQLDYWKQQLQGLPILQCKSDRPRPTMPSFQGASHLFVLSRTLSKKLQHLSQSQGATLFMTLLAAFQTLLYRYTEQEDIIVGSPIANRNRAELEGLIGIFVNTLVLRTDLSGNPSFRELLQRVRQVALGAYAHQDLPFEKLVEALQPERQLSHNPLFQVLFVLQNTPKQELEFPDLSVSYLQVDSKTAKFDLSLSITDTQSGLTGSFEYNTDLFDAATIARMVGHFQTLLEGIVDNCEQRLSELPLITAAERHQLLVEWNHTHTDYPKVCIHQLIEAQVEKTPDAVAVVFEDQQLTYQQLNYRANQLANYLRTLGVGPEVLVGICMERSLEMVVGLLGILKAGGAYVPLDPAYPQERLAFILENAQMSVLLTQQQLVERLPKHQARVICLDTDWGAIAAMSQQTPVSPVMAENLAYVIYTSGSTGKPKGVQIRHRSLTNCLDSMRCSLGLTEQDKLLAVTTISFDIAALELYLPLIVGAQVVLVQREVAADGVQLLKKLVDSGATLMQATPATWNLLLASGWQSSPQLQILCGGEALPRKLANQLLEKGACVWNLYGPTETTIWSTAYKVEANQLITRNNESSELIGRPIANTQIYILDRYLQLVPTGVVGELYIGGDGLARGYLNAKELTVEKFIPNPLSQEQGTRLYKTGDKARYLPDGSLEYLGRIDHQVKIRGFRIELEEIEAVLNQHQSVVQTVVAAREDLPGDKRLVAYVVVKPEQMPPSPSELRGFLHKQLPDYMIPAAFVFLDAVPLTPNGKINRLNLPAPDKIRQALAETFVAPKDELELQLTKIWEEVLGIQPIGVRDNFFELGGHSLLGVRLFAQIEKIVGKKLPLATLFRAPTVEQLASLLKQEHCSVPLWTETIPLNGQNRLPFWFVVQTVKELAELAKRLGTEQPLLSLESGYFEVSNPATHIKERATRCVNEIRTVQPKGPYHLGGFCMGGLVAFEMAQQLLAQGEKVALLALVNSDGPDPIYRLYRSVYQQINDPIYRLYQVVYRHINNLVQLDLTQRLVYIQKQAEMLKAQIFSGLSKRNRDVKFAPSKEDLLELHWQQAVKPAIESYTPQQAYPGRVVLLLASRDKRPFFLFPKCGWGKVVTGAVELCLVPGDHHSVLEKSDVQVLALKLRSYLDAVQADD